MKKNFKVGFLITARLKSTRLPKKLLIKIHDKTVIEHMIERLKFAKNIDEIVICTSTNKQDEPLTDIAKKNGVKSFQGDPDDVLARLLDAAKAFNLDYILNITADCPLVDPFYADQIVNSYIKNGADLIRQFDLPHGVFSYGIKVEALKKIVEIKESKDTEVWGRYFTDTGHFNVVDLKVENSFHIRPGLRMTLDYPEDLEFLKSIYNEFYSSKREFFNLDQILHFLDKNPQIVNINKHCGEKFSRRFVSQSEPKFKTVNEVKSALIIGTGSIGQRHIKNLKTLGVKKIAALRSRKGHYQKLPKGIEIEEFDCLEELDKKFKKVDIAIIANPSSLHIDAVEKVLDKVKGIFIEKPISNSLLGIDTMIKDFNSKRVVSYVGFNMMFHPILKKMQNFCNENNLGKILSLQLQVGQWLPDWHPYEDYKDAYYARKDLGGGVSLTMIHEIHMALKFAGAPAEVVGIISDSEILNLEVDVCSDIMIKHTGGAVSQIHLDYIQKPSHRSGTLTFERGWLSYDLTKMELFGQTSEDENPKALYKDLSYDANEMYVEEMTDFIKLTQEGRVKHDNDAESSIDSLRVVEAIFESSINKKTVKINSDKAFSF